MGNVVIRIETETGKELLRVIIDAEEGMKLLSNQAKLMIKPVPEHAPMPASIVMPIVVHPSAPTKLKI